MTSQKNKISDIKKKYSYPKLINWMGLMADWTAKHKISKLNIEANEKYPLLKPKQKKGEKRSRS